jgi:hypothetical protein
VLGKCIRRTASANPHAVLTIVAESHWRLLAVCMPSLAAAQKPGKRFAERIRACSFTPLFWALRWRRASATEFRPACKGEPKRPNTQNLAIAGRSTPLLKQANAGSKPRWKRCLASAIAPIVGLRQRDDAGAPLQYWSQLEAIETNSKVIPARC